MIIDSGHDARVAFALGRDRADMDRAIDRLNAREVEGDLGSAVALALIRSGGQDSVAGLEPNSIGVIDLEGGGGSAATAPRQGESARPDDSRFQLVEEFGDFQETDGLQLPRSYTIRYSGSTVGQTVMATWALTVTALAHNAPIDDKVFTLR